MGLASQRAGRKAKVCCHGLVHKRAVRLVEARRSQVQGSLRALCRPGGDDSSSDGNARPLMNGSQLPGSTGPTSVDTSADVPAADGAAPETSTAAGQPPNATAVQVRRRIDPFHQLLHAAACCGRVLTCLNISWTAVTVSVCSCAVLPA